MRVSEVRYPKQLSFSWVFKDNEDSIDWWYCSLGDEPIEKEHYRIGPYRVCRECYLKITDIKIGK